MSVRVLATSMLYGSAVSELGKRLPELKLVGFRSAEWNSLLPEAEGLIITLNDCLSEEEINRAVKLKAIGTFSVGINHIPQKACAKRGIVIANTPGVLTDATADISLSLLLAVARRVLEGDRLVRTLGWKGWRPDLLLGTGLNGKTCGIMGSGPIGLAVASRVHALGMKVIFWDRTLCGGTVDYGFGVAERKPTSDLLAVSNVLCLNCPLTDSTRNLLTKERLLLLPKGALLINAARGGVVDEVAVIELLHSGHLGGAGFDVFENEPDINPLWLAAPNTVLLPHLGSATAETRDAMARMACERVAAVIEGKL